LLRVAIFAQGTHRASLASLERMDDAVEFMESNEDTSFMDSKSLILASTYPDRQLRFPDS
jgi:hypothetical protein